MQQEEFAFSFPELREAFEAEAQEVKKPRLLLTAAVPVGPDNVRGGYDVPAVARSVSAVVACCGPRLRCACRRKVSQCCCGLKLRCACRRKVSACSTLGHTPLDS